MSAGTLPRRRNGVGETEDVGPTGLTSVRRGHLGVSYHATLRGGLSAQRAAAATEAAEAAVAAEAAAAAADAAVLGDVRRRRFFSVVRRPRWRRCAAACAAARVQAVAALGVVSAMRSALGVRVPTAKARRTTSLR